MSLLSRINPFSGQSRSGKTRFIVLCWARTGSYLLTDLLDQQPGIVCHEEVFKSIRVELRDQCLQAMGVDREDTERRDAAPEAFAEEVFTATQAEVVGFKIFPPHNPALLEQLLDDPSVRTVLLLRNPIQVYISLLNARQSGKWTQRRDRAQEMEAPVTFDRSEFLRQYFAKKAVFERCLLRAELGADFPLFVIDYSQLHDRAVLQRLAEFLGRERWSDEAAPSYFKQLRKPYPEMVANWDEVESLCAALGVNHEQTFGEFTRAVNAALPLDTEALAGAGGATSEQDRQP